MSGSRTDQFRVTVTLDGDDLGVFDSFDGGDVDSQDVRHRPGSMGPEISLGGPKTITNFTVGRLFDLERDLPLTKRLASRVGKGQIVAKKQSLDRDGNAVGQPDTYTGVLKMANYPKHDSNASDRAMLALEVTPDGEIT